ncbi:hypothetical protein BHE74_00020856 [Ensete ventricosum]|nr:hypothetical protein BHE74_00020856 [Ensete ventricosum]
MQRTAHVEEYLKTSTPQGSIDRASDKESLHDLAWGSALVDTLRDQVGERPKATPNEGTLGANVKIELNRGEWYDSRAGGRRSIAKRANTIGGGGDPVMCWQRPHIEKLSYGGMIGSYREHHFGEQHDDKKAMDSRSECHVGELDCSRAYTCLREPDKSEDKDE